MWVRSTSANDSQLWVNSHGWMADYAHRIYQAQDFVAALPEGATCVTVELDVPLLQALHRVGGTAKSLRGP